MSIRVLAVLSTPAAGEVVGADEGQSAEARVQVSRVPFDITRTSSYRGAGCSEYTVSQSGHGYRVSSFGDGDGCMTLSDDHGRLVGFWAADCADRVLPLFEAKAPLDARPREAIDGIRIFARGGRRTARLRSLALAALEPHATSAIRPPRPLLAQRDSLRQLRIRTRWPRLAKRNTFSGLRRMRQGPANSRQTMTRASVTRRSGGRSSMLPRGVRAVMRRYPVRGPGRSRLDALDYQLDAGIRR
jgi:hypothetical protein